MNQETLEEFAEREATEFYKKGTVEWNKFRQLIEVGGKWQMKRSYNEEELLEILASYADWSINGDCTYYEWFEQFKKK